MTDFYVDDEYVQRSSVKAALLLAKSRYDAKFSKFVKNASRLSYVDDELTTIAHECSAQVGADPVKVEAHLRRVISDELENSAEVPKIEGEETVDIKSDETVGEIENQDERVDLNSETGKFGKVVRAYVVSEIGDASDQTTWKSCYRCEKPLNPVVASVTPVCPHCTTALLALSAGTDDDAYEEVAEDVASPVTDGSIPGVLGDVVGTSKALEIVSLQDGKTVETIPLAQSDPDYIARITLALYRDMDRDRFFIREVELPVPQGLDIGDDQEEGEIVPLENPVPPIKQPTPEKTPAPSREKEPVHTHVEKEAIQLLDPNAQAKCDWCSFTGTPAAVQLHEQQAHPEEMQQRQQMGQQFAPNMAPAAVPGAVPGMAYSNESSRSLSFDVVARFDTLQDFHSWNAGRGN